MTTKFLGLTVVGLACALSLAQAQTAPFGDVNMKALKAAAAQMPVASVTAARGPRGGQYSPTRAESINVSLGVWHNYSGLPNCGGAVKLSIVNGHAIVSFGEVKQCSNFDILQTNLEPVRYPNQKLDGRNGDRFGTFAIPQQFIEWGYNSIVVAMKSDSGKHQDLIEINFSAR